jgi:hypothetical protein
MKGVVLLLFSLALLWRPEQAQSNSEDIRKAPEPRKCGATRLCCLWVWTRQGLNQGGNNYA